MKFIKMQGLGNDFIITKDFIIDEEKISLQVKNICNRHFGIGGDGFIVVDDSDGYSIRIYNADGSEASVCGNALRCLGELYLEENERMTVKTKSGEKQINKTKDGIMVNMGNAKRVSLLPKVISGIRFHVVNIGNFHSVAIVDNVDTFDLESFAKKIRMIVDTNVVIVSDIIDSKDYKIRVYERGVGETNSCASGACASYYALRKEGFLQKGARVKMKGGNLLISDNEFKEIVMQGEAKYVFEGEINEY